MCELTSIARCLQVTVLGEVKIVGLLILSAAILPGESSQFTARMTAGCAMAMLGFCLYSNAKIVAAKKSSSSSTGGRAVAADGKGAAQEARQSDVEEGKPLLQVSVSSNSVLSLCKNVSERWSGHDSM